MSLSFVIIALIVILFLLAFITKRRFGVLGLALFAGSYLAHTWTGATTPLIEKAGISPTGLGVPLETLVGVILTLLPAFVLLVNSPKYHGKHGKIIGSIGFSLLAVVLLVPVLETAFVSSSATDALYAFIITNYSALVTIGLIAAIFDLFLSHQTKTHHKKHSGEH